MAVCCSLGHPGYWLAGDAGGMIEMLALAMAAPEPGLTDTV